MRKRKLLHIVLVVLTFVMMAALLPACRGGREAATPTPAVQPTPTKPTAAKPTKAKPTAPKPTEAKPTTPPPPTNTPAPPTPEVKPTPTEEVLADAEIALQALRKLKSFRSYTHYSWTVQEEGKAKESSEIEIRGEHVAEPPSQRLFITLGGDAAAEEGPESFELIQIEDQIWYKLGEDQWMQIAQQELIPFGPMMNAVATLRELHGARRLWPDETVNGIRCRHYRFTEKNLPYFLDLGELSKVEGDLWVAVEGDFAVKYVMHAEGGDLRIGEQPGYVILDLLYEVSDVGADIVIEPPTGGGPAIAGFAEGEFPVPEGTEMSMSSPGLTIFVTALPVAEVAGFYKERLGDLGWTKTDEISMGNMVSLSFVKDTQQLNLMIGKGEENGKTQIIVNTAEG